MRAGVASTEKRIRLRWPAARPTILTEEKGVEQSFRIGQSPRDLPTVLDGVEKLCHARGLPTETGLDVRLVAEEILTNVVKYARVTGKDFAAELQLAISSEAVRMEFRDTGPPFNPLDASPPVLKSRAGERGI